MIKVEYVVYTSKRIKSHLCLVRLQKWASKTKRTILLSPIANKKLDWCFFKDAAGSVNSRWNRWCGSLCFVQVPRVWLSLSCSLPDFARHEAKRTGCISSEFIYSLGAQVPPSTTRRALQLPSLPCILRIPHGISCHQHPSHLLLYPINNQKFQIIQFSYHKFCWIIRKSCPDCVKGMNVCSLFLYIYYFFDKQPITTAFKTHCSFGYH